MSIEYILLAAEVNKFQRAEPIAPTAAADEGRLKLNQTLKNKRAHVRCCKWISARGNNCLPRPVAFQWR